MKKTTLAILVASLAACASNVEDVAPPRIPPTPAAQPVAAAVPVTAASAPAPTPAAAPPVADANLVLPRVWTSSVGLTDVHTTMAVVGRTVVIGTHGGSFDSNDDPSDGVHLVDGVSGFPIRTIATPGRGDRDVNGIAVDGGRVYFTTDNKQVVAARLEGPIVWKQALDGVALAAPTLADLNGDGTLDVVVGDDKGRIHAFEGKTGNPLWSRWVGAGPAPGDAIEAGIGAGDLNGDGVGDLVAASWNGDVLGLDAKSGRTLWTSHGDGRVRASPVLVDVDDDGRPEVLVAWERGAIRILDGATGHELWSRLAGHDDDLRVGILGSVIPFVGAGRGLLAVPAGRETAGDGLVLFGEDGPTARSGDPRVLASAVVTPLVAGGAQLAVFGSGEGNLVAMDPRARHRTVVARVGGPVAAAPMVADTDGDGVYEILVAAGDGSLTCFTTGARDVPAVSRFRGDSPTNDGLLRPANLGWSLRPSGRISTK